MAKIDDLFKGSEGIPDNVVFYKMNGNVYVRTKPSKFSDRKSPAQLAQRQRLQVVNSFLKPFREVIRVTFASEAQGRSALQAAQSFLMRNALTGEYPDIYVDKSKAALSSGSLALPLNARVEAHPEGLLVKWENGAEAAGKAADNTLVVIAHFENAPVADYVFTEVKRTEGQFLWKLPVTTQNGPKPDVWIAFRNAESSEMSNSLYIPY